MIKDEVEALDSLQARQANQLQPKVHLYVEYLHVGSVP